MNIEKTDYINSLLDIYAELLTPYQQEIMDLYYQEDLSLKEIADEKEISRNAVFTLINRVEKILINYEEKLHLLDIKIMWQSLYICKNIMFTYDIHNMWNILDTNST